MLLTTYNPDSQATCPNCKKHVNCWLTGGNMWSSPRKLELTHECGEVWEYYVDLSTTKRITHGDPLYQFKKTPLYQWGQRKIGKL